MWCETILRRVPSHGCLASLEHTHTHRRVCSFVADDEESCRWMADYQRNATQAMNHMPTPTFYHNHPCHGWVGGWGATTEGCWHQRRHLDPQRCRLPTVISQEQRRCCISNGEREIGGVSQRAHDYIVRKTSGVVPMVVRVDGAGSANKRGQGHDDPCHLGSSSL